MRAEGSCAAAGTDTCTLLSLSSQHSCVGVHSRTARDLALHSLKYKMILMSDTLQGRVSTLTVAAHLRADLHPIGRVVAANDAGSGAQENMTCSQQFKNLPSVLCITVLCISFVVHGCTDAQCPHSIAHGVLVYLSHNHRCICSHDELPTDL